MPVRICQLNSAYPGFPEVGPARIVRSLAGFLNHGGWVSEGGGNTPLSCPCGLGRFHASLIPPTYMFFKTVDGVRHQRGVDGRRGFRLANKRNTKYPSPAQFCGSGGLVNSSNSIRRSDYFRD